MPNLKNRLIHFGAVAIGLCSPCLLACCLCGVIFPAGIGDVEEAQRKIQVGMTKEDVRSVLGRAHYEQHGNWFYNSQTIGRGCILCISFGRDDRVTSSEWWVD